MSDLLSRRHPATMSSVTSPTSTPTNVPISGQGDDQLEPIDRELLNAVQWDFPLDPRPFAVLGRRLGLSEPEVRERIAHIKDLGVLRQLSAIFDTRALGYNSALVAAKIDPSKVDQAAWVINGHPALSALRPFFTR